MKAPQLTAREVLERLHLMRRVLEAVSAHVHAGRTVPLPPSGVVLEALQALETYARYELRRAEIAAYAHDVEAYARLVLGELLARST